MEYVFSDILGRCKVEVVEGTMRVESKSRLGSPRLESHALDTLWPVSVKAQFSNWQRSALMLPGLVALTAVLIEAYPIYKASLDLYITVLLAAFAMLLYGAWLGSVVRFITVALKNGKVALRVVQTASNEAAMASLIDVLKAQTPKEPETVTPALDFWIPQDAQAQMTVSFIEQLEDRINTRRFLNQAPKSPETSFPLPLVLMYWVAVLAGWAAFDTLVRKHNPDVVSIIAGVGAFVAAIFLTTLHHDQRARSRNKAQPPVSSPDTHVYLTPEAITHISPSLAVALRWKQARHLKVEECGIGVYQTCWVIFIPSRAFMDENHRAAFINGIISYAPHLNAEVQFTGQKPVIPDKVK